MREGGPSARRRRQPCKGKEAPPHRSFQRTPSPRRPMVHPRGGHRGSPSLEREGGLQERAEEQRETR
eukprot:1324567-Prorocentrum_lima.AAC.1